MNLRAYQDELRELAERNGWSEYLKPREIALALAVEVGELLDLYKWETQPTYERESDELADVAIFVLQLADRAGIDLESAVAAKMHANWLREPDGPRFKKCPK